MGVLDSQTFANITIISKRHIRIGLVIRISIKRLQL